jgi:hypothetical protein
LIKSCYTEQVTCVWLQPYHFIFLRYQRDGGKGYRGKDREEREEEREKRDGEGRRGEEEGGRENGKKGEVKFY